MQIPQNTLNWLLEEENPGVRYLALKDLVEDVDPAELESARVAAYQSGPIAEILGAMNRHGFWEKQGAGYTPKYKSGVWSLISLAMLGARVDHDPALAKACKYYIDHAFCEDGGLTYNGKPHGYITCLQGNMCAALTLLGVQDERLDKAFALMSARIDGSAEKYYSYAYAPGFSCSANNKKECAWGAVKTLWAYSTLPSEKRSAHASAIQRGVDFLFSVDPVTADYPTWNGQPTSSNWWRFGFPVFYITDMLQAVDALAGLGFGEDPLLKNAVDRILSMQDEDGRWKLGYNYGAKTWMQAGVLNKPNKWVTYRVLSLLTKL